MKFNDAYDALRHFDKPERASIHELMDDSSPARLCRLLNAAGNMRAKVADGQYAPCYLHSIYGSTFERFDEDDGRVKVPTADPAVIAKNSKHLNSWVT